MNGRGGMQKLSRWLVDNRVLMFLVVLAITAGSLYLASTMNLYDDPNRWPPKDDPAVALNERLQSEFGGANLVTIMITRRDGSSIVNDETLDKIRRITSLIREIHGVIPYTARSLSTINSRYLKGSRDFLDSTILFDNPTRAPQGPEELARTKFGIENNASLRNLLVSTDWASTIIQADFRTGLSGAMETKMKLDVTDPIAIYKDINEIILPENDDLHEITASGSPILIGWVNSDGLPYVVQAFSLVVAGIAIVLLIAFRSEVGLFPPILVGLIASAWAFGMQRLVMGSILESSSALLAPFIIMAVAASHGVLFTKRFLQDELIEGVSKLDAMTNTVSSLMRPLVVVLLTDLMAFVVLSFVPFDNVKVLGSVTAFGLIAIMLVIPTFLVAVLCFFPESRLRSAAERTQAGRAQGSGLIYRSTAYLVRPLIYNRGTQQLVLVISVLLIALSLTSFYKVGDGEGGAISQFFASKIEPSQNNTYAVHNYLTESWEGNPLYEMEMEIKERFGTVYTMMMLVEGPESGSIKTPEALVVADGLSRHLEELDEVPYVVDLPFFIKVMNRFLNEDQDDEFRIPIGKDRSQMAVNEALYFLTGGMPGAFDFVTDPTYTRTATMVFVKDTSAETVEKVVGRAQAYIDENWDPAELGDVVVHLPGGNVGIADAFNRSIKKWALLATLISALASFVAAALMLRSFLGPILLMFPLAIGMVLWAFLIHLVGIEFNSNVTAALAIASGVGIDAEVYLLFRFREEYVKDGNFHRALYDAFTLVREPLIFSFTALFAGCLSVSFVPLYVGYVGFSMALILLTTFLLSFFVAPVVWSMVQPQFLTKGLKVTG